MAYHAFPSPNPYLDMKEKKDAYLRHLKALRSPRHIIDNSKPETPSRLVTRKNRYIEMQRMIMKVGDDNIKLISNYNSQRENRNDANKLKSNTPSPCKNASPHKSPITTPSPSSRNITPTKKVRPNINNNKNNSNENQHKKTHDDWISEVAAELAILPSIDFLNGRNPPKKVKKEDHPCLSPMKLCEENNQNDSNLPRVQNQKGNTTFGDAGYQARLESVINDINGIED